jgi:hypothetical protein
MAAQMETDGSMDVPVDHKTLFTFLFIFFFVEGGIIWMTIGNQKKLRD